MKNKKQEYRFVKQLTKRVEVPLLSMVILYKVLTVMAFVPLMRLLWALALRISPAHYVISGDMGALLRSPVILPAAALMAVLMAVWCFYEFSLIIHGIDFAWKGKPFRFGSLFRMAMYDLAHLLKPKNLPILVIAAVLVPFTNIFLTSNYISQLVVPEYIMEVIRTNPLYHILYLGLMAVGILLTFFWIFSFHFFILDGKSFREAIRGSRELVSGNLFHTASRLILWNLRIILKYAGYLIAFFFAFTALLFVISEKNGPAADALGNALTLVQMPLLCFLLECMASIMQISFISVLYYQYRGVELDMETEGKKKRRQMVPVAAIFCGGTLLTGLLAVCLVFVPDLLDGEQRPTITCHRGYCAVAPENTLPAFQAAIDAGADCAELDVQLTKDGVVMVTHDTNLVRCTGKKADIDTLTFEEVRKLDAGSWFSKEFTGTRVPTLDEVVKLCKGKIRLNIEIKQNGRMDGLEEKTVQIIRENGFEQECSVTSLNYESLRKVKEASQDVRTGYILALGVGNYYDLPDVDFFSVETTFVTTGMVSAIHQRGKTVSAWTIDKEDDAKKMIDRGVDDLITGNPSMVRQALNAQNQMSDLVHQITEELRGDSNEEPETQPEDLDQILEGA